MDSITALKRFVEDGQRWTHVDRMHRLTQWISEGRIRHYSVLSYFLPEGIEAETEPVENLLVKCAQAGDDSAVSLLLSHYRFEPVTHQHTIRSIFKRLDTIGKGINTFAVAIVQSIGDDQDGVALLINDFARMKLNTRPV